jgi:hypothetical protein
MTACVAGVDFSNVASKGWEVYFIGDVFFKSCNKNKTICVQECARMQRFEIGDRSGLEIFKTFYF